MEIQKMQDTIKELQEWQKEHTFESPLDLKSIKREKERLEQEYVQFVVSMLTDNIEQWVRYNSSQITLRLKNYILEVGEYGWLDHDDYRIKIYISEMIQLKEIFDYYAPAFSSERKLIKRSLKKVGKLHEIKEMHKANELLCKSFDALREV
jgi:hypothetical protein